MSAADKSDCQTCPLVLLATGGPVGAAGEVAEAVRIACWQNALGFRHGGSSDGDVLGSLGDAECLVADTTGNDPCVTHDIGVAHALGIPVICLRHSDDADLLADLQDIRFIHYGDLAIPEQRTHLTDALQRSISKVLRREAPEVIDSFRQRTQQIVADFETLLGRRDLHAQTLCYSGVLSPLAMAGGGYENGELPFRTLLDAEKAKMIELAERGCRVACMISPPSAPSITASGKKVVQRRLDVLIEFIEEDERGADVDWVWSPYRQKTLYIVGDVSCIERFRKQVEQGVDLTLRQTSDAAIGAYRAAYDALFERLAGDMCHGHAPHTVESREARRSETLARLRQLRAACDEPVSREE